MHPAQVLSLSNWTVRNSLCNEACLLVISWEHFPKDETSRFGVAIYGATSAPWPVDIVFLNLMCLGLLLVTLFSYH